MNLAIGTSSLERLSQSSERKKINGFDRKKKMWEHPHLLKCVPSAFARGEKKAQVAKFES